MGELLAEILNNYLELASKKYGYPNDKLITVSYNQLEKRYELYYSGISFGRTFYFYVNSHDCDKNSDSINSLTRVVSMAVNVMHNMNHKIVDKKNGNK